VRRPRSRLALRIYLAGLLQFAAVLLGFTLFVRMRQAGDRQAGREARASVEAVVARLGDATALARELDRVQSTEDATLVIYDDRGQILATNRREGEAPPGPPPGPPPDLAMFPPPPGPPPVPAFMLPVRLPDGRIGRAVYALRTARSLPREALAVLALVLGVVGIASWLTARSLARPLARLSGAAREFGKGRLDARAGMARSDEIGDVASAFDEMADRVTALLRAEKELLANVSHELRTPLARIRVALDLAAEGDAGTAREALGEITEDLAELERLISDVLTAARLDLGTGVGGIPPLRLERVDLGELCARAAARLQAAHPERPLVVAVAAELPAVEGDPVLLRRVLDNLLENAHRYAKGSADEVELHTAPGARGSVRIEIRDHGIGIAPEDLPHVFRPFFRADRSRNRATGGLGLGLALARRIVEAHHGTLALESRLGEGTRAVVLLPAAELHIR